jgi:PAS domain-containing protein
VEKLRRQVKKQKQKKQDLDIMLETVTEHADHLSEALEKERSDLAMMLEMTTEHADVVEDELHERAEAALLKSERQLRMIVEATPAPVVISRVEDGEIVYANAMMGTLFKEPTQDLLGRNILELFAPARLQR